MDREQILKRIEKIKGMISKAGENEALIVEFQDELLDLEKQLTKLEAREELKKEMEALELENARLKEGSPKVGSKIEVTGVGDRYKGYRMKKEVESLIEEVKMPSHKRDDYRRNPEKAEGMAKWFLDMFHDAMENPVHKAMSTTTTAGGYLTPDEHRPELLSYIRENSLALQYCQRIPMTSDVMNIPRENAKATVAYTSEATDATEASPTFEQVQLTAQRMDGYVKVSNELLMDAQVNGGIVGMLLSQFTEAIGLKVDSTVFIGTGSPMSGVFLNAGLSETFDSGSTNFSELLESNIRNIIGKIQPERITNGAWYVHHQVLWQYFRGLKDSNGNYLFQPDPTMPGSGTLWGWPVRSCSQMISTSAAETGMAVFGDLSGVIIGDRLTNIQLFSNPYILSRSYQTEFEIFTRWAFAEGLPNQLGRIVTASEG